MTCWHPYRGKKQASSSSSSVGMVEVVGESSDSAHGMLVCLDDAVHDNWCLGLSECSCVGGMVSVQVVPCEGCLSCVSLG
jgi:hypothetical protein